MVVGADILCGHGTAELATTQLVRSLGLYGAIAAHANGCVCRCTTATYGTASGHDIDDATHGVGAIEHAGGTAQHLHTFGHHRLIAVAERMAIDALVLWMPIDEHHQLSCATRYTTKVDATSSTR